MGSEVQGGAYGADASGRSAFILALEIGPEAYRLPWPVFNQAHHSPPSRREARSSQRQAFRDLGRAYDLPDAGTAGEATAEDFLELVPPLMLQGGQ